MTHKAYVLEKNGKFWSKTKSKWLSSPADGCTFENREEVEALAATSGWEASTQRQIKNKRGKILNIGHDRDASPPGVVREVTIEVKG